MDASFFQEFFSTSARVTPAAATKLRALHALPQTKLSGLAGAVAVALTGCAICLHRSRSKAVHPTCLEAVDATQELCASHITVIQSKQYAPKVSANYGDVCTIFWSSALLPVLPVAVLFNRCDPNAPMMAVHDTLRVSPRRLLDAMQLSQEQAVPSRNFAERS